VCFTPDVSSPEDKRRDVQLVKDIPEKIMSSIPSWDVLCETVKESGGIEAQICGIKDPSKGSITTDQRRQIAAYCSKGPEEYKEMVGETGVHKADIWSRLCLDPQSPYVIVAKCFDETKRLAVDADFLKITQASGDQKKWEDIQSVICKTS